eukprot:7627186-Alexandrium_andersonii.AAC.1
MSASLVGSEMCIRDRCSAVSCEFNIAAGERTPPHFSPESCWPSAPLQREIPKPELRGNQH